MLFFDEARIHVKAGDGGDGCVSFLRESRAPRLGPDGGDGGRGGHVFLEAVDHLDTLMDFVYRRAFKAPAGRQGTGKNCTGRSGKDLTLQLPAGTLIYDDNTGELLCDLATPGMQVRICRGGKGGYGNTRFASATHQAPRESTPGEKGQARWLRLELKLIADVGLLGLPNAGKSSLLAAVSAARPRVAAYPFTTLIPKPGIVQLSGHRRFVLADIPGLIEGAHTGRGLGDQFLRHIERTRVLLHLVEIDPPVGWPPDHYHVIRRELEQYSQTLAGRTQVVCLTKADLVDAGDDTIALLREEFARRFGLEDVFVISSVTGQGLPALMEHLWRLVQQAKALEPPIPMRVDLAHIPPTIRAPEAPNQPAEDDETDPADDFAAPPAPARNPPGADAMPPDTDDPATGEPDSHPPPPPQPEDDEDFIRAWLAQNP